MDTVETVKTVQIITYITLSVISTVFGFVLGYIARGVIDKTTQGSGVSPNVIAMSVVLFVFTISVIVDIINPNYETPLALYALMSLIIGYFFKPIGGQSNDKK